MTTKTDRPAPLFHPGPNFIHVLVIGIMLGCVMVGNVLDADPRALIIGICLGLAWAYLFLEWVAMIGESMALAANPIPDSLDVADRAAVRERMDSIKRGNLVAERVHQLMASWCNGGDASTTAELAAMQSAAAKAPIRIGVAFIILLLIPAMGLYEDVLLTWSVLIVLALTVLARQVLLDRIDAYIMGRLLSRLPANISQTAMTASDLAGALGGAINKAFKDHVPQPEQTANAMKSAVEGIVKDVALQVEKMETTLAKSQSELVGKWMDAATTTTTDLKSAEKALSAVVNDLTGGLSSNMDKMRTAFQAHTHDLDKAMGTLAGRVKEMQSLELTKLKEALEGSVTQIGKAGENWGTQLQTVLSESINRMTTASQNLADQLGKIAALEADIEKVLHVQGAVEQTMKAVASTEEFKQTMDAIRSHLGESDKMLRELAKPRTIRLVETDIDAEKS